MTGTMRTLLVVSCHHFYDDILLRVICDSVCCVKSHSLGNEQVEGYTYFSFISVFLTFMHVVHII